MSGTNSKSAKWIAYYNSNVNSSTIIFYTDSNDTMTISPSTNNSSTSSYNDLFEFRNGHLVTKGWGSVNLNKIYNYIICR